MDDLDFSAAAAAPGDRGGTPRLAHQSPTSKRTAPGPGGRSDSPGGDRGAPFRGRYWTRSQAPDKTIVNPIMGLVEPDMVLMNPGGITRKSRNRTALLGK
jgi:hypothetical protein